MRTIPYMRTLQEFCDLVCGRPATRTRLRETPGKFGYAGPPGKRYLLRELLDGTTYIAPLPSHIGMDEVFNDGLARRALENLELDPRDFGY